MNAQIHPCCIPIGDLLAQCRITRSKASGPGGQHRNKVESAVEIHHLPTGISGRASERRSQHENRRRAIRRLRVNLAIFVRTELGTCQPSELWRSRCPNGRISLSPEHDDFPALLAEAMNHLHFHEFNVANAARGLNSTISQLMKLLRIEKTALAHFNNQRSNRSPIRPF